MRKTSKLLLMVLLLFAFFSCKDDDDENDYLNLSVSTLRFSDQSERQSLLIESSSVAFGDVKVDCPAEWVFVEFLPGKGQYAVTVPENPDPVVRTAIITLTAGNCVKEIDVLQAAHDASLELTSEHVQCWDLNYQVALGIKTKEAWTATPSGDWFQLEKTSGKGNDCIRIFFPQNTTSVDRKGEVIVKVENGAERVFTFTQTAALPDLGVKGDSLACAAIYKHFNGEQKWKDCNWCQAGVPFKKWDYINFTKEGRVERISLLKNMRCDEKNSFPEEIKYLTKMVQLTCNNTGYKGPLPYELLRCPIEVLFFIDCAVEGKLEPWLGSFFFMREFDIRRGNLSGELPYEMGALRYIVVMSLPYNKLTGEIPNCWNMRDLSQLKLNNNLLTGGIPESCGNMTELSILDVSGNTDMTGQVPESVCLLTYSSWLVNLFINDTGIKDCEN